MKEINLTNRSKDEIPLNLYLIEFYTEDATDSTYIMGGSIEEVILKFRKEGFENEIYNIYKSKVQHLIF